MDRTSLIWAAVPHNSDGVVFQVRMGRGQQRFHISRDTLRAIFDLGRDATDAVQLDHFYMNVECILREALRKRSKAGSDTLRLDVNDFIAKRSARSDEDRVARI
ncbi:hypothetical protein ACV229_03275 [Burkholderia sp. MR1-5-21]